MFPLQILCDAGFSVFMFASWLSQSEQSLSLCSRSKETPHVFLSYFHGVSFTLDPSLVENLLSCVCETNLIFSKPATKLSECFSAGVDDPHLPYANLKASPAFFPVYSGLQKCFKVFLNFVLNLLLNILASLLLFQCSYFALLN